MYMLGRAMAQAVSRRPLIAEARVRSHVSLCGICGGQSGTGTVFFSPSTSGFPCQLHYTDAPLIGKTKKTNHLHNRLIASKLRCVRSICCGDLYHKKRAQANTDRHCFKILQAPLPPKWIVFNPNFFS